MLGGDVIRRARTRSGLSAAKLARQLGVSEAEMRAWEGSDETLRLTPEERLRRMLAYVRFIKAGRAAVLRSPL
jgi:DNA-binding transcriptional regulator YiaG